AQRPLLRGFAWTFWLGAPYVFLFAATVLKRIVFDHGKALWIDDGMVIYLHRWNLSAPCRDIVDIGRTKEGQRLAEVILRTHHGAKRIPTSLLTEQPDLIIARLKAEMPWLRVEGR